MAKTTCRFHHARVLAAAAIFAGAAGAASAQSAFVKVGPETVYDAQDRCAVPRHTVADFNGDGRPDFVLGQSPYSQFTANPVRAALMLFIAQPDGSYAEQSSRLFAGPVTAAYGFNQMLVADFNGDGKPDIFVADPGQDQPGTVGATPVLALSTPAGLVDASATLAGLPRTFSQEGAVADIDANGSPDVFITSASCCGGDKASYILVNDGQGRFTRTQATLPSFLTNWASHRRLQVDANTSYESLERFSGTLFADLDRDGYPDLVLLPDNLTASGYVLLNDGTGDFSRRPPIELPPGLFGAGWMAPGGVQAPGPATINLVSQAVDINGDGYPDLLIQQTREQMSPVDAHYNDGRIQILINQAGRGFADETALRGAPGFDATLRGDGFQGALTVTDVNGDGFPDIVASRNYIPAPYVYLNDGTGRFAAATLPGIPADGIYIVVDGGFRQPTRIVNIRYTWGYNAAHTHKASCVLRVQTWERPAPVAATPNYQGLWWASPAGVESGWGINFAHQGDTIFATWFTYDLGGKGWWLSMVANKTADRTYSGSLIQTSGPAFSAAPFDPAKVTLTTVGTGVLKFTDGSNGTFDYTVQGTQQTKTITRELFGPAPTCSDGASPAVLALATNYQDLWWAAPANSESGWGINLTHQGDTIFGTWFTYDTDGTAMWLVTTAKKQPTGTYAGALYRTTGPAFSAVPFNPGLVISNVVGNATFTFTHGNAAKMEYSAGGVAQTKNITRQLFSTTGTYCQR